MCPLQAGNGRDVPRLDPGAAGETREPGSLGPGSGMPAQVMLAGGESETCRTEGPERGPGRGWRTSQLGEAGRVPRAGPVSSGHLHLGRAPHPWPQLPGPRACRFSQLGAPVHGQAKARRWSRGCRRHSCSGALGTCTTCSLPGQELQVAGHMGVAIPHGPFCPSRGAVGRRGGTLAMGSEASS